MEREDTEALIGTLIEPALVKLGYELVRVQLAGTERGLTLQIMADRADGKAMLVDDCTTITKGIDLLLDEADPIPGAYALEVSSPGIDRPLTRPKDFAVWAGHEAKIELKHPLDGRKKYKGILGGLDGDKALIKADDMDFALPLTAILKARLVLTDSLIKAVSKKQTDNEKEE